MGNNRKKNLDNTKRVTYEKQQKKNPHMKWRVHSTQLQMGFSSYNCLFQNELI